jgi:two-component system nitrogen regulation response regulator GlnG/two-component system response regulator HydG
MSEADTLPDANDHPAPKPAKKALILTVIWAPGEGRLLGSSLLPLQNTRAIFGRGDGPAEGGTRLRLVGLRPGDPWRPEPSTNPRLSRSQIRITAESERQLRIENVGLCPLIFDDREVQDCELTPGDIVVLGNQMAFLCHARTLPERQPPPREHPFGDADQDGIVGESEAIWALRRAIDFAAKRDEHSLILGASGTGKELVANAIHKSSHRARREMVSRNAATIPETLADAELFGNAKNYPNPGMMERPGLIGQAHQSTLFLDEFAELPQPLQAHLLRVLDAGEYQRLGEAEVRSSSFRLLAATNRPVDALKEDVAARFFFKLRVPDLNERREDIPLIARYLLRQIGRRDREAVARFFPGENLSREPSLSRALILELMNRTYRTHVRELTAILWESIHQSSGSVLELPSPRTLPPPPAAPSADTTGKEDPAEQEGASLTAEKLQQVLDENNGSIERSWKELGLSSRYALRRLIVKLGVQIRKQPGRR